MNRYDTGNNVRALMLDACVCSSHRASHFSGRSRSTFSLFIASMRAAVCLASPHLLSIFIICKLYVNATMFMIVSMHIIDLSI